MKNRLGLILIASLLTTAHEAGAAEGDASKGAAAFKQRCAACHSLEPKKNRVGPSLAGVLGRKIGSEQSFRYSQAYTKAPDSWTEAKLDSYMTDPAKMFPGSRMTIKVTSASDRANIIAYLKTNPKP